MEDHQEVPKADQEQSHGRSDTYMSDATEAVDAGHVSPNAQQGLARGTNSANDAELLDERVERVMSLQSTPVVENEAGYLVSYRWLSRVFAKSTKMHSLREWDHDALTASIGRIDNSNIVTPNAFTGPHLRFDGSNAEFIPLAPQLERGMHFEVLPKAAWDLVVEWYGVEDAQKPIIRYARDTAPSGSAQKNIIYEYYPPVFTVRKMLSARSRSTKPLSPTPTSTDSNGNTRQASPEIDQDSIAVKLVASRQDRFNTFLARSKRATGIPIEHKVRPWRQLDPRTVLATGPAIPTPIASRSVSPAVASLDTVGPPLKLVVEKADFDRMQEGTNLEMIDTKDNTANANYNGSLTLDLLGLGDNQILILEEQLRGPAGGEYASDAKRAKQKNDEAKLTPTPSTSSGPLTRGRARRDGRARGTIGLTNLGNTCYMNSALQCISRIEELAFYFLANRHKAEINTDNPLGYNGRMAKAYADFLHSLYQAGASSAYTPRAFKGALSQAQPMFSGYGQQDSQEFLSFLVDALHEDLNRIHKKPYLENPDSDDTKVHDPEYIKELGNVYRDNHRKRNDSIAMDLFNGFYKNTMVCPSCDKISVTFDPYSLLTLQLPVENTWQHKVFVIPATGKPMWHMVDLDKNASVRTFKQYLAAKLSMSDPQRLFVIETFSQKIYKVFRDGESVGDIAAQDIILVFELPEPPSNISKGQKPHIYRSMLSPRDEDVHDMESPLADRMAVTVLHRVKSRMNNWTNDYQPMIIMLTREEAKDFDAILKKILAGVAKYTSRSFLDEDASKLVSQSQSRRSSDSGLTSGSEDAIQVDGKLSDRSVPSEDEYVNVSIKEDHTESVGDAVPSALQPNTAIPTALRSLFDVRYFRSPDGDLHCAGNSGSYETFSMLDRVQSAVSRRSSITSVNSVNSRSTEASGMSVHSQGTSSTEADDIPKSPRTNFERRSPADGVISDEDLAPEIMEPSPLDHRNKPGRRKVMNSRRRNNQVTYGKKSRQTKNVKRQPRSEFSSANAQVNAEDDPYYIKLGEGICLDWTDEGYDALFGGDPREPENARGYMTLNENFMTLVKDEALEEKLQKRMRRKKEGVSLADCFAETSKTETLSEENAWYCNRCKELRRADKTLMIWTAPDILVVHLKRFSGERYRRDKVDVLVDFPIEGLDLSDRIGCKEDGKDYVYDLFAVDNHYGGLGGGHYTAYAKNFFNDKWYDFNDSFVSEQGNKGVVSPAAYLLFYRRRSSAPLGPAYLQELVQQARSPHDGSDDDSTPGGSGEGRLDDSSLRHGSSSALPDSAGAAPRPQTTTTTTTRASTGGRLLLPGAGGRSAAGNRTTNNDIADEDEGVSLDVDKPTSSQQRFIGPARPPRASPEVDGNGVVNILADSDGGWNWAGLETADDAGGNDADSTRPDFDEDDDERWFEDEHDANGVVETTEAPPSPEHGDADQV
ncbi:hypothetical protein ANO11243_052640 [Dothideomycetidae sp. 11243]|nr:hypothetical protein ANO11243_052640 [fungal sp. No.11243]